MTYITVRKYGSRWGIYACHPKYGCKLAGTRATKTSAIASARYAAKKRRVRCAV